MSDDKFEFDEESRYFTLEELKEMQENGLTLEMVIREIEGQFDNSHGENEKGPE